MDKKKYLKSLIIRVLISLILFLLTSIFVNYSDQNLLLYKKNVYDKSLKFNKISALYDKYFKEVLPVDTDAIAVNKIINYTEKRTYKDGVELIGVDNIYPYKSGIVVFTGEKEEYGNTIIIEGMDGIDYWYSNVDTINVKLYDYVESDNIIGIPKDNKLIALFYKEGELLNYEEYI